MDERLRVRIMKCIDKGLSRMGEIKGVLYWHFEHAFGASRDRIPERIDGFVKLLNEVYGNGAWIVSFNIIKELEMEFRVKDLPEELDKAVKIVEEIATNSEADTSG